MLLKRGDKYVYLFMLCLCILVEGCQRVGWHRSVFWKRIWFQIVSGLEMIWPDYGERTEHLSDRLLPLPHVLVHISHIYCLKKDCLTWFTLSIELFRLDGLETVKCLLSVGVVKPSFWLIADCTDVRPGKIGFWPTLSDTIVNFLLKVKRPDQIFSGPLLLKYSTASPPSRMAFRKRKRNPLPYLVFISSS